jgi:hypothetical protein
MNLEVNNLMAFKDFKINFSYPKKIVNSSIDYEYLQNKPNFRYKKVNIIMGSNASGKTSLGKILMYIFNFISKGQISSIENSINDIKKEASFKIDFLLEDDVLYRVSCNLKKNVISKTIENLDYMINVYKSNITKKDSYESCMKKFKLLEFDKDISNIDKLKSIPNFGWYFELTDGREERFSIDDSSFDLKILEKTLMVLDSDIISVKKLEQVENSFFIEKSGEKIIIQNGEVVDSTRLSSGTKSGITIAKMLSAIIKNANGFYYCDEKFSFIHTEVEKALISVMISSLHDRSQLFFTTHNSEILDMDLPKHSFTFLRKKPYMEAMYPQDYIKKDETSLYNAVKNDIFSCAPDLDKIFELEVQRNE